jgi:hypothetical protein
VYAEDAVVVLDATVTVLGPTIVTFAVVVAAGLPSAVEGQAIPKVKKQRR